MQPSGIIEIEVSYFLFQAEPLREEISQMKERLSASELENEQLKKNLTTETRQLAAIRAEMDQLRQKFKTQHENHTSEITNLCKAHSEEVAKIREQIKDPQRDAPAGLSSEDLLNNQIVKQVRFIYMYVRIIIIPY